jgi:hypothetical protein
MRRKIPYKVRIHSIRRTYPMRLGHERHCLQRLVKHGRDPNEGTSRAQGALQNGPLRAMCIPRPAQETKHKYEEKPG